MSFLALILPTLKDVALGLVTKIAFKVVLERFSTRIVIAGLEQLVKLSTNQVIDETLEDVIASLKGKGLKVVEDKINAKH